MSFSAFSGLRRRMIAMLQGNKSRPRPFIATEGVSLRHVRQADVIPPQPIPVLEADSQTSWLEVDEGLVVLSQECDLVQTGTETALVAPMVRLPQEKASLARKGRMPRYVHVPALGTDAFVDLDFVATMRKDALVEQSSARGVNSDAEVRRFGQEVGRRPSRFPFPDEVVPWLRPLREVAQAKALKPDSPEGRVFAVVEELRIESKNSWTKPPYDLLLSVLVEPGELPVFEEDLEPDLPADLDRKMRPNGSLRPASDLAAYLLRSSDRVERYYLWDAIGQAWAARCQPAKRDLDNLSQEQQDLVKTCVVGGKVAVEVLSTDEFLTTSYLASERLDLAHLSDPLPRWPVAQRRSL